MDLNLLEAAANRLKQAYAMAPEIAPPEQMAAPAAGAAGAPPMDPAAMGAAPPMDPAMAGGMPPMDPAMMGAAPPMPPEAMAGEDPLVKLMDDIEELRKDVKLIREAVAGLADQVPGAVSAAGMMAATDTELPPASQGKNAEEEEAFEMPEGFALHETDGTAGDASLEAIEFIGGRQKFSAAAKVAAKAFKR